MFPIACTNLMVQLSTGAETKVGGRGAEEFKGQLIVPRINSTDLYIHIFMYYNNNNYTGSFSEPPVVVNIAENPDDITFTLSHHNEAIVDHYNVVLVSSSNTELLSVTSTTITIPWIPSMSYSGTVSAVDTCGRESASAPLNFGDLGMVPVCSFISASHSSILYLCHSCEKGVM